MEINSEIRSRIIAAAEQLFDEANRERFPAVDLVRRLAKADMNTTSAVMREWRRQQTAAPVSIAVEVPARIQDVFQGSLIEAWQAAKDMANESLRAAQQAWDAERTEADDLRREVAEAYELQAQELESTKQQLTVAQAEILAGQQLRVEQSKNMDELVAKIKDLETNLAASERRGEDKAQRIEELRTELAQEKAQREQQEQRHQQELEAMRQKFEQLTAEQSDKLTAIQGQRDSMALELAAIQARSEAQQEAAAERQALANAEIRKVTADLVKVSESADEEVKWLKKQLEEALTAIRKFQEAPKSAATRKRGAAVKKVTGPEQSQEKAKP